MFLFDSLPDKVENLFALGVVGSGNRTATHPYSDQNKSTNGREQPFRSIFQQIIFPQL